jgi:hypothetical protein
VLLNIGRFVCLRSRTISPPVLKADRVGCQDDNPLPGQCRPKRLQGIAHQTTDFTLPKVSLAVVLMMDEDTAKWSIPFRQ